MYATSDLSAMYKSQIPSVKRTVSLVDKKFAVIEDELTTNSQFTKVRWNMDHKWTETGFAIKRQWFARTGCIKVLM